MRSSFGDTIKGAVTLGISSSLVTAVGFLLIPLYTRYLSVEEFGLLGLISLTMSLASAIFSFGLNSAIFRSYFDYEDQASRRKLIGTALIMAVLAGTGLVVLATFSAEALFAQKFLGLPGSGQYLQLALYTSAVSLVSAIPLAIYRAIRQFSRFAIFNISSALLQIVLIVLLVVFFHLGIKGILLGQFATTLVINVLLLYSVRTQVEVTLLRGEVRKLLAYGLPLVPGAVFYLVLTLGSLYFVQGTGGLAEAGVFNLAMRIASVFTVLVITPFQLIWPPMMFSVEKTDYAERFYANMLVYAVYVSVGISIILSVFSSELIAAVSTPDYNGAAQVVWLLLYGHILFVVQNVLNVGIILKRKTIYWSTALVVETMVCILLWLLLSPQWGVQGIAIGSIIGYCVGIGITLAFSRRFLRINYEWKRTFFLLTLLPLAVGISHLIPVTLNVYAVLVLKVLVVLFLVGSPFLIKFWHPDELATAKQMFRQFSTRLLWRLTPAERN
jgi:O-antigen/teichoic acid export membrane protein